MKKLYIYIATFAFLPLSVFATDIRENKLFINFANTILGMDKDTYLVLATANLSLEIPKNMKSLSIDNYRAMLIDSMNRFGVSHNFLFIKESFCKDIEGDV